MSQGDTACSSVFSGLSPTCRPGRAPISEGQALQETAVTLMQETCWYLCVSLTKTCAVRDRTMEKKLGSRNAFPFLKVHRTGRPHRSWSPCRRGCVGGSLSPSSTVRTERLFQPRAAFLLVLRFRGSEDGLRRIRASRMPHAPTRMGVPSSESRGSCSKPGREGAE